MKNKETPYPDMLKELIYNFNPSSKYILKYCDLKLFIISDINFMNQILTSEPNILLY